MAYGRFDGSNIVPLILAPVAAASELAVFELGTGVNSLFNFQLSDAVFSLSAGTDVTISMIVYIASVGAIVGQGQLDKSKFEREEWISITAILAVLPFYQLIPALGNFIDANPIAAMLLWLGVSAGTFYISYTG